MRWLLCLVGDHALHRPVVDIHFAAGVDTALTRSGAEVPHDIIIPPCFFFESGVAHQRKLAVEVTFPGEGVQQCMYMLLPIFKSCTFNHVSHSSMSKLREECDTNYEP